MDSDHGSDTTPDAYSALQHENTQIVEDLINRGIINRETFCTLWRCEPDRIEWLLCNFTTHGDKSGEMSLIGGTLNKSRYGTVVRRPSPIRLCDISLYEWVELLFIQTYDARVWHSQTPVEDDILNITDVVRAVRPKTDPAVLLEAYIMTVDMLIDHHNNY